MSDVFIGAALQPCSFTLEVKSLKSILQGEYTHATFAQWGCKPLATQELIGTSIHKRILFMHSGSSVSKTHVAVMLHILKEEEI